LDPQVRAGVVIIPFKSLNVAADIDLTENSSLIEGSKDRRIGFGAEKGFLSELISLRAGLYKNIAEGDSNVVYTGGFGFRIFMIHLDAALGYDFKEREGMASISLAGRF
ncbi:MAG: hypothetical protein HY999_02250, partial [Nitrospinae bacterium]|nr:hypothetical protein [Nitrospinota bacterium]